MANYPDRVYLNGEIIPHEQAKISVFDRGFIFGDGIYEVMVQINGQFFYGDAHINRLSECLSKINIEYDVTLLTEEINRLLIETGLSDRDCLLYIQVTRGVAPRKHAFPKSVTPTVMMYAIPMVLPDINQNHIKAVLSDDYRWARCDIKMTSLLGNVMINDFAMSQGAYEAILSRNGIVTEASHCNIFFVKDSVVYTHPADNYILNGITRQIAIKLCHDLEITVSEVAVKESEIFEMDEVFLTGTTTQIASIQQIDSYSYYQGDHAGSVTRKIQEAFSDLKNRLGKSLVIDPL